MRVTCKSIWSGLSLALALLGMLWIATASFGESDVSDVWLGFGIAPPDQTEYECGGYVDSYVHVTEWAFGHLWLGKSNVGQNWNACDVTVEWDAISEGWLEADQRDETWDANQTGTVQEYLGCLQGVDRREGYYHVAGDKWWYRTDAFAGPEDPSSTTPVEYSDTHHYDVTEEWLVAGDPSFVQRDLRERIELKGDRR
jgi:hypothetical protein